MMKNPCYDPETHTDCPKRKVGCRKDCQEWKEYEADRRDHYSEKLKTVKNTAVIMDYFFEQDMRIKRKCRNERRE